PLHTLTVSLLPSSSGRPAPSVLAAGDVASFPVALSGGKSTSIYHWQIAQAHGHVAALNMLHRQKPLHTVPSGPSRSRRASTTQATGRADGDGDAER
ncbi:apoptosis-inducing factor 3-like, partial [Notechis scutatus]|uniref:L-amino-acid oxidase n=1 Tax=Notechis scutatus TaxID=8663 RepID=A0A6J1VXM1_9SAUR